MDIAKGLEGIIAAETALSLVDGERGQLVYRGYWAKEIALSKSFEEAAFLLWYGRLPNADELNTLKRRLAEAGRLPERIVRIVDDMPAQAPMMSVIRTALSALDGEEIFGWPPTLEQAISLTACVPAIAAYRYSRLTGTNTNYSSWRQKAEAAANHVERCLLMLTGEKPKPAHIQALSSYMILGMEHGLNASTFAARVIASTESDMVSAVCGAIGAMKGPLHGGAPSEVTAMLKEISCKENAEPWMRAVLERGGRLMGFGHRVYKTKDPRAEALREVMSTLAVNDTAFDLAVHTEATAIRLLAEYKPGRRLYTNVEFFAAALMNALGLPDTLFTPLFTSARTVGWTAHILEQAANNRIYRPQSIYIGVMPAEQE